MITVINRIGACDDGKFRAREIDQVVGVTLHHFGVPDVDDMEGIAKFYRQSRVWTGGSMPYTFGIHPGGTIEQGLQIREVGPHAKRWSVPTIGVVLFGNFDAVAPAVRQWMSAVELVAELCSAFGLDPMGGVDGVPVVAGHTERPNATSYPGKNCPGEAFPLGKFRSNVSHMIKDAAIQRLAESGVIA